MKFIPAALLLAIAAATIALNTSCSQSNSPDKALVTQCHGFEKYNILPTLSCDHVKYHPISNEFSFVKQDGSEVVFELKESAVDWWRGDPKGKLKRWPVLRARNGSINVRIDQGECYYNPWLTLLNCDTLGFRERYAASKEKEAESYSFRAYIRAIEGKSDFAGSAR